MISWKENECLSTYMSILFEYTFLIMNKACGKAAGSKIAIGGI